MCCYAFYCLIISFVTVYHCIVLIHIIKLWSFIFYITESVVISRITRAAIATHINIKEKRTSINKSLYRYRERFKRSTQSDLWLSQSVCVSVCMFVCLSTQLLFLNNVRHLHEISMGARDGQNLINQWISSPAARELDSTLK